jgi:outer membrane protein assembly factor BamB
MLVGAAGPRRARPGRTILGSDGGYSKPPPDRLDRDQAIRDTRSAYHALRANAWAWTQAGAGDGNSAAQRRSIRAPAFEGKSLAGKPMVMLTVLVVAAILGTNLSTWAQSAEDSVLSFHNSVDRSGKFTVPGLTWERARSVHADRQFRGQVTGAVYAQPLHWRAYGASSSMLLVATETNNVDALDAISGDPIWTRSLGRPVDHSLLRCGNIDPLGITGTPVVDESTGAIYLDADIEESSTPHHRVFALSLKDGSTVPGWPVDIADALRVGQQTFNARDQNERGALTSVDGTLYVPFGGHLGDCGDYHGWVVGISLKDPRRLTGWSTRARGGGIWAPGGISSIGQSLFVATGNTFSAPTWSDGEAVVRLAPDLHRSNDRRDYFAPTNWHALDLQDADLGATNPVILDVDNQHGRRQALLLALGKDGRAYLLDRNDLGGIGGSLATEAVSKRPILAAPAVYTLAGDAFVAFQGRGEHCPSRTVDGELTVLRISGGPHPTISTAWCSSVAGASSPIVTTTDGQSEPIVWVVGAEGDNRLHAFRGDSGEPLFNAAAGPAMSGLHHFQTLIATKDRLYVGADQRVYAFAF